MKTFNGKLIAYAVAVSFTAGCGMMGGQPEQDESAASSGFGPDWWAGESAQVMGDEVNAFGFGESSDLRMARRLSAADARATLAEEIGASTQSVVETGMEQAGSDSEAVGVDRSAIEQRSEQLLAGVGVNRDHIERNDDGIFEVFTEVTMDADMYEELVEQVAADAHPGISEAQASEMMRGQDVADDLLD